MSLRLRIQSTQNDIVPWEVAVVGNSASIGRDPKCTVALPDPNKHLSRQHAVIEKSAQGWAVTVNSKVNPVSVSGRDLVYAQRTELQSGDVLGIANFLLTVEFDTPTTPPTTPSTMAPAAVPAQVPASDDPFAWLDELKSNRGASTSGDLGTDPFADLTPSIPKPPPGPDPFKMHAPDPARADNRLVPGVGMSGDPGALGATVKSLDPLDILSAASSSPRSSAGFAGGSSFGASAASSPLDQWLGASAGSSAHSGSSLPLVDLGKPQPMGTPSLDHVHAFDIPFSPPPPPQSPPPAADAGVDFDLSELIGGLPDNRGHGSATAGHLIDPTYVGNDAGPTLVPFGNFVPAPGPVSSGAPAASSSADPTTLPLGTKWDASTRLSSTEALNAYMKGLGMGNLECTPEQAAEYLEVAGSITRAAVAGIMQLLLSRSEMKKELRADDRTMLASRNNNPLKMMSSSEEALKYLFGPKAEHGGAFLAALPAIEDACADILAHEFGLVAGLRAAVVGAIKQGDPQTIEKLAEKQGKLGGLLTNKKANLWDSYVDWYQKIEETCADDVDRLFERDFLGAYMAQVRRLRQPK